MNKLAFVIFMSISIFACKSSEKKVDQQSPSDSTSIADVQEDADLADLYQNYHSQPMNQKQIDENKIIEYAAAKNIKTKRSASGLYYSLKKKGNGPYTTKKHRVSAHYRGRHLDGKEFDSSYSRGKPIQFTIGEMIPGWNEAVTYMRKGDSATLLVPSHLAYGPTGLKAYIKPNEVLVFEMKIVDLVER